MMMISTDHDELAKDETPKFCNQMKRKLNNNKQIELILRLFKFSQRHFSFHFISTDKQYEAR